MRADERQIRESWGHHGPHPGHGDGRRHGRGRAPRGDVRAAVLVLLAEEPMHGYQLMQTVADRSGGRWQPSPGAIYPTINQLEDEGLITVTSTSGRRLATLTDAGRRLAEQGAGSDPFAAFAGGEGVVDLRTQLDQLHGAARQVARSGTAEQLAAAEEILTQARRSLYRVLADDPEATRG